MSLPGGGGRQGRHLALLVGRTVPEVFYEPWYCMSCSLVRTASQKIDKNLQMIIKTIFEGGKKIILEFTDVGRFLDISMNKCRINGIMAAWQEVLQGSDAACPLASDIVWVCLDLIRLLLIRVALKRN